MTQDAYPVTNQGRRLLPWILAYGIPAIGFLMVEADVRDFFVPLAGPFAARLYGHSCGMCDHAPGWTAGWTLFGVVALFLKLRFRSHWFTALAILWWLPWLLFGFVSMVNAKH